MYYVNARFLTQKITGVQRFSIEISKALVKIRDDMIFLVPSINDIVDKSLLNIFNIKEVKGFTGHLWEQVTLPLFLYRMNKPLLLNLTNTAPCIYANQLVTHHDVTYKKYPKSFSLSFRLIYNILPLFFLKNNKCIITVSEFSKKEIAGVYNVDLNNIHVVYNAVGRFFTEKPVAEKNKKDNRFFLAVSSPVYHKNFSGLIDCFINSDIDCELKIVGGSDNVFSKNITIKNDERIKFLGRVDDDELKQLYSNAIAFIFPSFYEGFGIPPLEAQACGCPVLSSNQASMPEVLGDSAIYFNPYNENEIINSIKMIISSGEAAKELIDKGYVNISRFSWEKSAEKINYLLEKIS